MPKIGDIAHGKEFSGVSIGARSRKFIFARCPDCDKSRWLVLREANKTGVSRCQSCCGKDQSSTKRLPHGRGDKSPHWKGGRSLHHGGYVGRWISEQDQFYPMATHKRRGGGTIFEHRLVMAQSLGRCLDTKEYIHHINGVKDDNRIENLELISPKNHVLYKNMCAQCKLREENEALRETIAKLRGF